MGEDAFGVAGGEEAYDACVEFGAYEALCYDDGVEGWVL